MKTTLFTMFIFSSLVAISQSEGIIEIEEACNPTDSLMNKDSAAVYRDVFKSVFNVEGTSIDFKRDQLNTVYSNDTNTFVRVYFSLSDTPDTLGVMPGLILVPFLKSDCQVELIDNVLASTVQGGPGQLGAITPDMMEEMAIWQDVYQNPALENFDTVYGYNFTWETIFSACGAEENDLRLIFGVMEDTTTNRSSIHLIMTNPYRENKNLSSDKVFMDFSKPCPKMCGWLINGVGTKKEDD